MRIISTILMATILALISSCASTQNMSPEKIVNKALIGSPEETKVVNNSFTDRSSDLPYVPIILPDDVERIWIFDHVTPSGDLVTGHWVFIVLKKSQWYIENRFSDSTINSKIPIPP